MDYINITLRDGLGSADRGGCLATNALDNPPYLMQLLDNNTDASTRGDKRTVKLHESVRRECFIASVSVEVRNVTIT